MQGLRRLSAPSGTVRATVRASGHSPCVYCGVGVHSCMRAAVACESATWRLPFSRRWQSDSGLRPASVQPMPMDVHSYAPAFAFITTLCRHRADVSKVWKELTANLLPLERNPDALATVLDYLCTVASSPAAKSVAACNIAEYVCDCLVRWSPLCVATPQLATLMVDVTKAFLDAGQPSVAASLVESCPGKLASPQLYDVAVREVVKPHTALPTHWTAGAAAPVPSAVQSVAYASACIVAASTRGVLLSPDVLALFGRAGAVHNPQAVLDAWSAVNTLLQKSHSPRLSMLATTALLPYVYACNVALGKVRDSLRQLSWLQQLTTAMGSTALTSATVPVLDATGGAAPAARGSSGKPAPIVLPPVALMRVNRAALAAVVWACVMNDHPAPLLAYEFCKTSIASVKLVDEDAGMVFRLAEALLLSGKPAECVDVLTVVHERFPALLPRVLGGSMLVPVNWPLRARTADLKYVAATAEAESITLGDAVLRSLIRDVDAYVAAARRVGLDPSASLAFAVRNPARVPHTVRLATRCMAAGVHFSEATVQCIVQAAIDVDNMHLLEAVCACVFCSAVSRACVMRCAVRGSSSSNCTAPHATPH